MAEVQQIEQLSHRNPHRHRRRRSKLKRRLLTTGAVIVFLVAWGFAVWKVTEYLGQSDELGKKYHDIDPGGFDKEAQSNRPY